MVDQGERLYNLVIKQRRREKIGEWIPNLFEIPQWVCDEYKWIKIIILGDTHIGSRYADIERLRGYLEWTASTPNAFLIHLGDMIENILPTSTGLQEDLIMSNKESMDLAVFLHRPLATASAEYPMSKMIGLHSGNHEFRSNKNDEPNPAEIIARELNTPFLGYSAFNVIKVGKLTYNLYTAHGSKSTKNRTVLLQEMFSKADAHMYAMGHIHEKNEVQQMFWKYDSRHKKMYQEKKIAVSTGGWLDWKDSYAERMELNPLSKGVIVFELCTERHDYHGSL